MKKFSSLLLFIIILTICLTIGSCLKNSYTQQEFRIQVDSIHAPDTIFSNIPFDIEFFGTVGWDGCYSFSNFYKTTNNNDILIEVLGMYNNKDRECPDVMVYLDGRKFNTTITGHGIYNIKITQPDYSSLEKQIFVK